MTTPLPFIIGLLTTVMSLLTFVQQHPELPQTQRDYIQQTAETAIAQATNIIANQKISSTNKALATTTEISTQVENRGLEIKLDKINKTSTTAQISWTTSSPVNSKITIVRASNRSNLTTAQYLPSANGVSKEGLVSVANLDPNTEYYYLIETTSDNEVVRQDGIFITEKSDQQIMQEKEDARWKALPTCPTNGPVRDGVCRIGNCRYENGHPSCGG